jgi:hypothetical protein
MGRVELQRRRRGMGRWFEGLHLIWMGDVYELCTGSTGPI